MSQDVDKPLSASLQLVYQYGDPERELDLRKLALVFASQMEDRVEAYQVCVNRKLWEGAIQACVDLKDEDRSTCDDLSLSPSIFCGGCLPHLILMCDTS